MCITLVHNARSVHNGMCITKRLVHNDEGTEMSSVWERALGFLSGVRREPCAVCWGRGYIVFEATDKRTGHSSLARGTCHRCEGAGSVEWRGTSEAFSGQGPGRVQEVESGADASAKKSRLTPAEKQRRYRERHGDEYRKREAARMRRFRERKKRER